MRLILFRFIHFGGKIDAFAGLIKFEIWICYRQKITSFSWKVETRSWNDREYESFKLEINVQVLLFSKTCLVKIEFFPTPRYFQLPFIISFS